MHNQIERLEIRQLFAGNVFTQTNLVSDGTVPAAHTDADLVNPWGLAFSPTGPFWIADNGTAKATLYDGQGNKTTPVVSIPGAGGQTATPTGQAYNPTSAFVITSGSQSGRAKYVFVGEDGGITAYSSSVDSVNAIVVKDNSASNAVYKGVTIATYRHQPRLFATNFASGKIEMYDGSFTRIGKKGAFVDPLLPANYVPFNVQNLNGLLYVTYAQRDIYGVDVGGRGHGYVNVFSTGGVLLRRFIHGKHMNSPWGLAVAPANFGPFAGDILVGMFGSGRIAVINPGTGKFLGFLNKSDGFSVQNDGLWALSPGNGASAGRTDTIYFTAGVNGEEGGLFGSIKIAA